MSLLIFAGIAARIPSEGKSILDSRGGMIFNLVLLAALLIIIGVVFVEQGQPASVRYIAHGGPQVYGGTSTYLPLKVNPGRRHPGHFRAVAADHPARDHAVGQMEQDQARQRLVGEVRRRAP